MKHVIFIAVALVCLTGPSFAAGPNSFECVRPDGSVVCTVNTTSDDPSVVCNHDCVDCNMTCAARQIVVREGNQLIFNPGAPAPSQSGQAASGGKETPQYCRQQYKQCVNRCQTNKNNRTQYDIDACISSCDSALSGCGRKP
jgi:hypothetical protein